MNQTELTDWVDKHVSKKISSIGHFVKPEDFLLTGKFLYGKPLVDYVPTNVNHSGFRVSLMAVEISLKKNEDIPFVFNNFAGKSLSISGGSMKMLDFFPEKSLFGNKSTTSVFSSFKISNAKELTKISCDRVDNFQVAGVNVAFEIEKCESLTSVSDIPKYVNSLIVTKCENIKNLDGLDLSGRAIEELRLKDLDMSECSFENMKEFPRNLGTLSITNCGIKSMKGFEKCDNILNCKIKNCNLEDLQGLENVRERLVVTGSHLKSCFGGPRRIENHINLSDNELTSLDNVPKLEGISTNLSGYVLDRNSLIDFEELMNLGSFSQNQKLKNSSVRSVIAIHFFYGNADSWFFC
jgi:hypothetical protein